MLQKEVPTNPTGFKVSNTMGTRAGNAVRFWRQSFVFTVAHNLHQPHLNWRTHLQEWQQSVVLHHVTFIHRLCTSFDSKLLLMKQKSVSWLMHIDFHNNINTFSIPAEIFKVKCLCQLQSSCRRKEKKRKKKGTRRKKKKTWSQNWLFCLNLELLQSNILL